MNVLFASNFNFMNQRIVKSYMIFCVILISAWLAMTCLNWYWNKGFVGKPFGFHGAFIVFGIVLVVSIMALILNCFFSVASERKEIRLREGRLYADPEEKKPFEILL